MILEVARVCQISKTPFAWHRVCSQNCQCESSIYFRIVHVWNLRLPACVFCNLCLPLRPPASLPPGKAELQNDFRMNNSCQLAGLLFLWNWNWRCIVVVLPRRVRRKPPIGRSALLAVAGDPGGFGILCHCFYS